MKYFEKINEELKKYIGIIKAFDAEHEEKKSKLTALWGNGMMRAEKEQEENNRYNGLMIAARREFGEKIREELAEVHKAITDYVTKPLTEDFERTINLMKMAGSTLTDGEIAMWLDKYKDNYLARKIIYHTFGKDEQLKNSEKTYDTVKESVLDAEKEIEAILENPRGYLAESVVIGENNFLNVADNKIAFFLDGNIKNDFDYEFTDKVYTDKTVNKLVSTP